MNVVGYKDMNRGDKCDADGRFYMNVVGYKADQTGTSGSR